jgi:hypothetical protein
VDRARELVPEIASLSAKLADALGEYNKLSSEHMISIPWEGLTCMDLIETAGRNQDRRRASSFEHFSLPYFGNSDGPRRVVDTRYLPQPHDMIRALATAFEGFYPMAIDESMDYANSKQTSRQHAIIRHFEDHWSDYQGQDRPMLRPPDVMAARFEIGAADLARILTALFGFDFSRESVTYARRQRREKRKN